MVARIRMEVLPNIEAVAKRAAGFIASEARTATAARNRFLLATSGGSTPWRMLELLATEDMPWSKLHMFQVDERIVDASDPQRNLLKLQSNLLTRVNIPSKQIFPMPVDDPDLSAAVAKYAKTLQQHAGNSPQLDLIHLGLGADGHMASLIPGDSILDSTAPVAISLPYQGTRRMTLTFSVINNARRILWVVTGSGKADALSKLLQGDRSIPAARVATDNAVLLVDADLARELESRETRVDNLVSR